MHSDSPPPPDDPDADIEAGKDAESTPAAEGGSNLVSRNITVAGHRTSCRLEPEMWNALRDICERERISIHQLCTAIDDRRPDRTSLTSAIRVFILGYYQMAATDEGHRQANHGTQEEFIYESLLEDVS